MKTLLAEADQRVGCSELARACGEHRVPYGASWARIWACVLGFAVFVQVVTGFFLWMYYSPGAQTAWESVYYLQNEVAGGWLLRAVHHYSGHTALALVIVYLLQMVATASYRAPRELVFWAAIGVGLFILAAIITGDLLYWDRNGYTSTSVRTSFLNLLPGVGQSLLALATGGSSFGHLTLTRFLAFHIGLFGGGTIALVLLHGWLARRADVVEAQTAPCSAPWWPAQAWRNAIACLAFLVVVFALSLQHGVSEPDRGVFHGSPADPANRYNAARPEWMLVGVFEFSHLFPPSVAILPIFVLPGAVVLVGLAMPFLARSPGGQLFNVGFTAVLLVGLVGLTCYSYAKDAANEEHQAAIAAERALAERARELARGQGIPATGALTLLRGDAKIQGPRLFKQHCASCHNYSAPDERAILAKEPSAPEMYNFATREWIAGFFDPAKIAGPNYFGNTAFKNGGMVGQVKQWWKDAKADDLVEETKEDLKHVAAALSAQAELKSQRERDAADQASIEAGRKLIGSMCGDCHRFYETKGAGAPDLTGYGSRAWTRAIIADPAHPRFYGKKNDRMPSYEEIISPQELDLITDWLRGEWFEAEE